MTVRSSTGHQSPFPEKGGPELNAGIPRNYEIFDPLDFLAAVT